MLAVEKQSCREFPSGTMEKVMAARNQRHAARSTRLAHREGQALSSTNLAQSAFMLSSDSLQVVVNKG